MEKFRNKPQNGSLFRSKFKTNDGSEEDSTREDYYGTLVDENDIEWKLKGYINENQYGKWLKIITYQPEAKEAVSIQTPVPAHVGEPNDDIPF